MRSLQLILGSTAFLLCLWLTTGLLGSALLEPSERDCSSLDATRQPGPHTGLIGSLGPSEITRAVCLLQRDAAGPGTPPATLPALPFRQG